MLYYSPAAMCGEYWSDFFGSKFSHFWAVRGFLSVVWLFFLPSLRFHSVVSDSERESFQKIPGETFKLIAGLTHDSGIPEILSKIAYLHVWDNQNPLGSCAARNV